MLQGRSYCPEDTLAATILLSSYKIALDLPGWFKPRRNLSEKEIEEQYWLSSCKERSYLSLQAKLYQQGFGYLCNKKNKPSHEQYAASQPPASARKISATKDSIDRTQLPVAMDFISKSLILFTQQSSGTQSIEVEFELGGSPWQEHDEVPKSVLLAKLDAAKPK